MKVLFTILGNMMCKRKHINKAVMTTVLPIYKIYHTDDIS